MRVYVSGPMSGISGLNLKAFVKMAERLAEAGHQPITPFDFDQCYSAERPACLRWDVEQLLRSQAIVTLKNWQNSLGARFEMIIAEGLNLLNLDRQTFKPIDFELPLENWKPPVIIGELAKAGFTYHHSEASWNERTHGASYARQTLSEAIRARTRAIIIRLKRRVEHDGMLLLREDNTAGSPESWVDGLPSRL